MTVGDEESVARTLLTADADSCAKMSLGVTCDQIACRGASCGTCVFGAA